MHSQLQQYCAHKFLMVLADRRRNANSYYLHDFSVNTKLIDEPQSLNDLQFNMKLDKPFQPSSATVYS